MPHWAHREVPKIIECYPLCQSHNLSLRGGTIRTSPQTPRGNPTKLLLCRFFLHRFMCTDPCPMRRSASKYGWGKVLRGGRKIATDGKGGEAIQNQDSMQIPIPTSQSA